MSIQTKILEGQRKVLEQTQELLSFFEFSWAIIPFQVSGIQDYTNMGYVNNQIDPSDAETFKRIWVGSDSPTLSWYGSVSLEKENNKPVIKHKIGKYILGTIRENFSSTEIDKDNAYSDYTSQQIRKSVTFEVSAKHFQINEYWQLMLYKIPKYSKETIYKLSSINKRYEGKELVTYSLTFESANQDFATTGQARQQNINMSAVGQGYLNPLILNETEFQEQNPRDYVKMENGEYLTYDLEKLKNRPARYIVVKAFGNAMLKNVTCIGRPVKAGEPFNKWNYSRAIFPVNLKRPSTPTLYRTSNHSDNYYWGGIQNQLEGWKDFTQSMKDLMLPANVMKYEGFLKYTDDLKRTNEKDSNGTYQNTLYGKQIVINNKMVNAPWEITLTGDKTINTIPTHGVKQNYKIGGTKAIHDRMWDTFWTEKSIINMPIDIKNTTTYQSFVGIGGSMIGLGSGIFGKFNKFQIIFGGVLLALGIGLSIANRLLNRPAPNFYGILNASLVDLNEIQFTNQNSAAQRRITTSILTGNGDTPSSIYYNSNTLNTTFEAELTEFFTMRDNVDKTKVFSTGNIGQTKDENGNWLFSDHSELLVSGNEELVSPSGNIDGYIIDAVYIQSIFKGDFSIEFLDINKNVIWSGIYQSQAKWSDNICDLWTVINTSVFNSENVYFSEPLPYPAPLPEPEGIPNVLTDLENNNVELYQKWNQKFPTYTNNHPPSTPFINLAQTTKEFVPSSSATKPVLFKDDTWTGLNILDYYKQLVIEWSDPQYNVTIDLTKIKSGADIVTLLGDTNISSEFFINTNSLNLKEWREYYPPGSAAPSGYTYTYLYNCNYSAQLPFSFTYNIKYYKQINQIVIEVKNKSTGSVRNVVLTDNNGRNIANRIKTTNVDKVEWTRYFYIKSARLLLK